MNPQPFQSKYGYTHPDRDKDEMCPHCKNEDTRRIRGHELEPYEQYHKGSEFKALHCQSCKSIFHFALDLKGDRDKFTWIETSLLG